jgi:hypothetical protein
VLKKRWGRSDGELNGVAMGQRKESSERLQKLQPHIILAPDSWPATYVKLKTILHQVPQHVRERSHTARLAQEGVLGVQRTLLCLAACLEK